MDMARPDEDARPGSNFGRDVSTDPPRVFCSGLGNRKFCWPQRNPSFLREFFQKIRPSLNSLGFRVFNLPFRFREALGRLGKISRINVDVGRQQAVLQGKHVSSANDEGIHVEHLPGQRGIGVEAYLLFVGGSRAGVNRNDFHTDLNLYERNQFCPHYRDDR